MIEANRIPCLRLVGVAKSSAAYGCIGISDHRAGPAGEWPMAVMLATQASALPPRNLSPGSFAVGDVRAGSVKGLATAVGEGSMAITFVHKHLREAA
jgi:hypothetical protein